MRTMTVENINEWRKDVFEKYEYETTEGGKFPHRTGSTVHAMNLDALSIIFDLAIHAVRVENRTGKRAEALAAEKIRMLADSMAPEKKLKAHD